MAEIHLFQWTVAFGAAIYLTSKWLLERPTSRWRHIALGFVNVLLWIPVAYTSGNVAVSSGGVTMTYGSEALGGVATFMIVVCLASLLVGLMLWTEETADEAHRELPSDMQHRPPRGD